MVDQFTKTAYFGALQTGYTAGDAASLFIQIVIKLHGFSLSIISDRDPIFTSNLWRELMKASGTTLKFSTAYHP